MIIITYTLYTSAFPNARFLTGTGIQEQYAGFYEVTDFTKVIKVFYFLSKFVNTNPKESFAAIICNKDWKRYRFTITL